MSKQCTKPKRKRDDSWFKDKVLLVQAQVSCQILHVECIRFLADPGIPVGSDALSEKAQQLEPMLYVGDIIQKTNPIVIPDSEATLTLAEESRSKMLLKYKDNMMQEKIKQIDTTPIDYAALNKLYKDFETRPTNVEIPKELPKVNMVNTSLKKLKYICYFDVAVEQHRVESKTFEVKMNQALNENERLLGWTKLFAENEHLKQTYKQRYDSIKPARVRSKEQCADLTNQVNLKSMEISDLNACLQEKVLVAHSAYIKRTQEEAAVFRDLVDHIQVNYPLDPTLESACVESFEEVDISFLSIKVVKVCLIRDTGCMLWHEGSWIIWSNEVGKVKVLRVLEMMEHDSGACICGALMSVDTNDIFSNNEFLILDVRRKIISKDNCEDTIKLNGFKLINDVVAKGERGFNVSSFMNEAILKSFEGAFGIVWSRPLVMDFVTKTSLKFVDFNTSSPQERRTVSE
ncbi:hypothetical protein Tco_1475472 [Tanacetum coccineum]